MCPKRTVASAIGSKLCPCGRVAGSESQPMLQSLLEFLSGERIQVVVFIGNPGVARHSGSRCATDAAAMPIGYRVDLSQVQVFADGTGHGQAMPRVRARLDHCCSEIQATIARVRFGGAATFRRCRRQRRSMGAAYRSHDHHRTFSRLDALSIGSMGSRRRSATLG